MAKEASHEQLERLICLVCQQLVAAKVERVGDAVQSSPPQMNGEVEQAVAILGFTGMQMSGSVAICAGVDLIHALHPRHETGEELLEEHLLDWLRELVNLVTGKFKRELIRCGIRLSMTPPTVLTGSVWRIASLAQEGSTRWFRFETSVSPFYLALGCEIDEKLQLPDLRPSALKAQARPEMRLMLL